MGRNFVSVFGSGGDYLPSAGGGGGDVTFDNSSSAVETDSTNSATVAHTVAAGSNLALFVAVAWVDEQGGTASVSSVSSSLDGGLSLIASTTIVVNIAGETVDVGVAWYQRLAPTVGAHTVTVTMSEVMDVLFPVAASFANVSQGAPTGTPVTSDQTGNTSYNHVLDTAAGDIALSLMLAHFNGANPPAVTAGTQQEQTTENVFWGSGIALGTRAAIGASTTISYTMRANFSLASGFAVKKA